MSGEGDDGIDAAATAKPKARPRPPAPVAPGDPAPRVGRVVAVRRAYDRYLSVEQRDVEVDVAGAKEVVSYDIVSHPRAHCAFVVAFPFHPAAAAGAGGGGGEDASTPANADASSAVPTVTLLREYCHGINGWLYTLPTGGLDPRKHGVEGEEGGEEGAAAAAGEGGGIARAAAAELSEEAGLEGGDWECLLPDTDEEEDEEKEERHSSDSRLFSNPLSAGVPEAKWCANRFWPFLVVGSLAAAAPGERDAEEKLGTMEVLRVTVPELESIILKGRMLLPSVQASFMALSRLRERGLL